MSAKPLLIVESLGKRFKVYRTPWDRALEWTTRGRLRRRADVWAVRGVSFAVQPGECFGIIGRNGAGKTTLLRLLAGVLTPTEGRFEVAAPSVYSLLELGMGLHPDLTGRENVSQSIQLLGLPAGGPEVVARIRAFAELGDFFDRPVRFYSSGMLARLGFSMFAFLSPDLLIVDEALSVGDRHFQQKCAERIDALREEGTAFLLVSHSAPTLRRLCARALVLHEGRPAFLGPLDEAIDQYGRLEDGTHSLSLPANTQPPGGGPPSAADICGGRVLVPGSRLFGHGLEVTAVRVTDDLGRDTSGGFVGDALNVIVLVRAVEPVPAPAAGLALFDRLGNMVFASGTAQRGLAMPSLHPGQGLAVRLRLQLRVAPGTYSFAVTLGDSEPVPPAGRRDQFGPLYVAARPGPPPFHGVAEIPVEFRHGPVEQWPTDMFAPEASS